MHACGCFTDIKKMPLGKLSKLQIAKGFEVLEEIEAAIDQGGKMALLQDLSSKFFTTIPHNFGRTRPPTIDKKEIVKTKKEMLMVRFLTLHKCIWNEMFCDVVSALKYLSIYCTCFIKVLADIELAQTLKSETEKAQEEMIENVPHRLDQDYNSLKCRLTLMDKKSQTFKVLCHQ